MKPTIVIKVRAMGSSDITGLFDIVLAVSVINAGQGDITSPIIPTKLPIREHIHFIIEL